MRFKRVTWNWWPLLGVHVGKNPVSGQRFVHVAFIFVGLDFNLPPYDLNDEARARLLMHEREVKLAEGIVTMAVAGGMPDSYWASDHRVELAAEVLGWDRVNEAKLARERAIRDMGGADAP